MLTRVKDLKASFIANCARQNGLPTGRTQFQDFEIAHFLNAAYDDILYDKITQLREGFRNISEKSGLEVINRDIPYGDILAELGLLYHSYRPQIEQNKLVGASADYEQRKLWGQDTRTFELLPYNGFIPYIIGADLIIPGAGDRSIDGMSGDKFGYYSLPVRILFGAEQIQHSLLLRKYHVDRLPYRIGRIRTESVFFVDNNTYRLARGAFGLLYDTTLGGGAPPSDEGSGAIDSSDGGREQLYLLEVMHPRNPVNDNKIKCNIEFIAHPEPIGEMEISSEADRYIEVAFGYKIAELASQKAMASLGGGAELPPQTQQRT